MSEAKAVVENKHRINAVWFLPIVAALLGGYMVVYTFLTEGPTITITFRTAEGLAAGKTAVKALNVDVGLVENVELADDLTHVIVTAKLDAAAAPLLREDSQFWVVRARVGAGGVSGLGTILSGGYIELAPGEGNRVGRKHRYVGLETPPVTTAGTPGVQIALSSERAGSVSAGDPVVYNGYTVGRIDTAQLDPDTKQVQCTAFIDAPYDVMVTTGTRFWNASGIELDASAQGIELRMASITTLVAGGVEFGVPDGVKPGTAIQNGHTFKLYRSYKEAREEPYQYSVEFVVMFDQSIRGLRPGAVVEFRGVPIGQVERIMLKEFARMRNDGKGDPIPVLISIQPGRLLIGDDQAAVDRLQAGIAKSIRHGLRATLKTGSLLTGALLVSFDYYPEAPDAELGQFAGYTTVPTLTGGFSQIEERVAQILDKVNNLELEATIASANGTLGELEKTLVAARKVIQSDGVQTLPADLDATLVELRAVLESFSHDSPFFEGLNRTVVELNATLQSLKGLAQRLETQPNSLIFSSETGPDPRPEARP